jgi:hypothetical protein
MTLLLTLIELEPFLEGGYNVLRYPDLLYARHSTTLTGTHVWELHGGVGFDFGRCGPIYWCGYSCTRIQ